MAAHELRVTFEVLTPLFLGGADMAPELRAASLKGLLRFWYRAADPAYQQHEADIFGGSGTGQGQSRVLLRIETDRLPRPWSWKDGRPERFNQGSGRNTRNGLTYLGYPFQMRGGERQAIPPGQRFTLRCLMSCFGKDETPQDQRVKRAVVAACWLLGHFGAAGSRSRRGFGSLALKDWEPKGGVWPGPDALPLTANAASADQARQMLEQGCETLAGWFPADGMDGAGWKSAQHPHLGPAFRHRLLDRNPGHSDWTATLAALGRALQDFRVRRAPDYQAIKDHVLALARRGGRPLATAPTRASFGLPLTFRYGSVGGRPVTFVPFDARERMSFDRHGSLLLLRLLPVGTALHPLFVRMDGAVPGQAPGVAIRGSGQALRSPAENAMDAFFDSLPDRLE